MGRGLVVCIILFVITLMLVVGGMIMNQICENNRNTISNQNWLEINEELCLSFFYLSDLINNIIKPNV
jgi:hypothetical protein